MFLDFQVYESRSVEDPEVYLPGAGSDHASFIFYAGVPVIDSSFDPVSKKHLYAGVLGLILTKSKNLVRNPEIFLTFFVGRIKPR